jgi:hypothetical protein
MLERLCEIAGEMPGLEGLEEFQRGITEVYDGNMESVGDMPDELQQADLNAVSRCVEDYRRGKAKKKGKGRRRDDYHDDEDDENDENETADIQPRKKRKTTSARQASVNLIPDDEEEQHGGDEHSQPSSPPPGIEDDGERVDDQEGPPPPILSIDDQETHYTKQKRSISYFWGVKDSRDVIPKDLREYSGKERKELEKYGKKKKREILKTLYELARITKGNRKGAWAKIKEFHNARKIGSGLKEWLASIDVAQALPYFTNAQQIDMDEQPSTLQGHQSTVPPQNQWQNKKPSSSTKPAPQPSPRRLASRTTRPSSRRDLPTPTTAEEFALQEALNARRTAERVLEAARDRRDAAAWAEGGWNHHRLGVDRATMEVEEAYEQVHEAQRKRWEGSGDR